MHWSTMHWSEWAALICMILFAIPFVLLLLMGASLFIESFKHKKWKPTNQPPPIQIETPLGIFTQEDIHWEGSYDYNDEELTLHVDDVDGQPDPVFLEALPAILTDLPNLEQIARQHLQKRLTDAHRLTAVNQFEGADFSLDFNYDEEAWGETVDVWFRNREVTGWGSVD